MKTLLKVLIVVMFLALPTYSHAAFKLLFSDLPSGPRDSLDEDGEDIEIDGRTTFQFIEKVGKRKVKAFFNNSPLNLELIETPFNTNNPFVQVHPDDVSNLKPHLGQTHPGKAEGS